MAGHCVLEDLLRIIIFLCITVCGQAPLSTVNHASTFTDCGGTLKDSYGIITSPNFPRPYPVPIYCRWVIEAPADKVIAVYFTQHYMRDGLKFSEYVFFTDTLFMDKEDFGVISSDKEPTYLISNKHVLVVEFAVKETGNIHLRIRQFLLDVFGFNITYEIVDKERPVRTDKCLYHHCSFTGNCYANSDYSSYYCSCFRDFFGEECQYNESCGPTSTDNLCMNNGTCRFYIGSTARTCECPVEYEGVRCEIKKEIPKEECIKFGCSHSCNKIDGNITCKCESGYRLAARDMKTCVEEGRTRYLVSFKLYDQNVDLAHLNQVRYNQLKRGVENALITVLKPRIFQVDNLTITAFKPSAIVQFQFFGQKDDNLQIRTVLEEALKKGKIDKYVVNRTYLVYDWEPALSIKELEISENMPVVEGTELTLACIVQATAAMTLKWLKDGAPINVHTPYRTLWTTQVPKNSRDQYTVLLGFDRINVLDSGTFTCQVSDSGSTHNKSKVVDVISVFPPLIEPLTATVNHGESFVVTCTPETYGTFGYNWLKNGKILNPSSEPERIEDLFPAGSRILVESAKSSVTYTCIIASVAGSTERNSVITVIDKDTTPVCPSEKEGDVEWSVTAANTVYRQSCPSGYTGEVSRRCTFKKGSGVYWDEPDFSSCFSAEFNTIKSSFESLKMGYLLTDLETVIHKLKLYLWSKQPTLHRAEGEPVVELLEGMLHYRESTKHLVESSWNVSETFTDIISFLLESPHLIQKQSHFIKLYKEIVEYGLIQGSMAELGSYHTFVKETFVVEVGHIPYGSSFQLKLPQKKMSRKEESHARYHPPWLVDSVELEINSNQDHISGNSSLSIAAVFFKGFSAFLPEHYIAQLGGLDIEYQLHSQPLAVAVKVIGEEPTEEPIVLVRVRMAHLNNWSKSLWNITCGKADFSDSKFSFPLEGCQLVRTSGNFTTCQCYGSGMYAVLLTSFTNPNTFTGHDEFEIIAGVGCGICAFLLCLTFCILLILWKKLKGAITALKLQVCIALAGAYITILKGLHNSLQKEYYSYVMSIIQFFLLAAFSMQLCLGLIVYIEFTSLQSIQYPELKVAAMGWAVPTIVIGATLAAQVPEGFLMDSWWLKFGTNFFYAYVISVFIILMLQLVLFLTVKAEIRHHQKIESLKQKMIANRSKLLHCSLVIAVSLLVTSIFSILYVNYNDMIFKYLFSLSSAALGMIIFLCYTFCSETASLLCCPKRESEKEEEKEDPKLHAESNSFKSFLKPEIVGEPACYINKLTDNIDKSKQLDQVQKLRPPIERCAETDWLEGGCLLQEKNMQLRVATVHSPNKKKYGKKSQFKDLNKPENPHQMSPRKLKWHQLDSSMAPTFELEPMYDSPRSNPLGKALENISHESTILTASRPPPYHDPCTNVRKEYSIKTNPLSTFDPQSPRSLKADFSALVVPKTTESKNSASIPNHLSSVKTINHNGRLTGKDKNDSHISHERIPLMSPSKHDSASLSSTPDDSTNPTNSVADLISRDDDFATEVEVPLTITDGTSRSGSEQVSPSRISWSTTAV